MLARVITAVEHDLENVHQVREVIVNAVDRVAQGLANTARTRCAVETFA